MKSFSFLLFFGVNFIVISSLHLPTLKSELDSFQNAINIQRITEIIREYWENDPSIQALITYLKSDKFLSGWNIIAQSEEIDDIFEWMQTHGVDLKTQVQNFSDDISSIHQSSFRLQRMFFEQFSLSSFEDEIRNEIKYEEMNELIDRLLKEGNDFAHLYLILKVSKPALEDIFDQEDIQDVVNDLIGLGVNVEYLKEVAYNVLRWN